MVCPYYPAVQHRLMILNGGERGIRTLDRVSPIHAFQACAFNRSAISPKVRWSMGEIARDLQSNMWWRSNQPLKPRDV